MQQALKLTTAGIVLVLTGLISGVVMSGNVSAQTSGEATLPTGVNVTDLVTLPNDGNPETQVDSAVYYVGLDGQRHPFPNEDIYFSWLPDYGMVKVIDQETMAGITLGDPILVRPGTHWVKIQSTPETYYVSEDYTLRHVEDEATAGRLGGTDWSKKVIDLPPTLLNKFEVGNPITFGAIDNGWPEGSLMTTATDADVYYTTQTGKRRVSDAGFADNMFQERFIVESDERSWQELPNKESINDVENALLHEQMTP
jgi:hypothetical protein